MRILSIIAGVLFVVFFGIRDLAAADTSMVDTHEAMQEWQFASESISVSGVSWVVDSATWRLESGSIRYMRPSSGSEVTGFIFEGRGRFVFEIADDFEIDQLRRFSGNRSSKGIDDGFSRMLVRTSGPLPAGLPAVPDDGVYRPHSLAKKRHEKWLYQARHDVDARVLAGRFIGGDEYLFVDMDTDSFDWLNFEFEPYRAEEIHLSKLRSLNEFVELRVSMDRAEHRGTSGRPSGIRSVLADLMHLDVDVDLTSHKGSPARRNRPAEKDWAHFRATVNIEAMHDDVAAIQFYLHPRARITAVSNEDGESVEFIRDHIGGRFFSVENDVWDGTVTVFPGRTLSQGDTYELTFEYDREIYNFVSGASWHPTVEHATNDLYTARLAVKLKKDFELWAVGEPSQDPDPRGSLWSVWEVKEPTLMVGFSFGKGFREERLTVDGLPEVVVLGDPLGFGGKKKLRNVGADVVNSLNFYQQYFGIEIPTERIYATSITSGHGQAFEGFLHLSQYTFNGEHPGASELFRAHEVAHQYWGHLVRWRSYRDQWLSEAFAEYSAMLFVKESMPKKDYFEEILKVYTAEQLGSFKGAMSKFARPFDIDRVRVDGEKLGPIAAGYRASTASIPSGGTIQLYRKGPLVLHMIHMILNTMAPQGQDPFRAVMHEFLKSYSGKEATTEDFQEILEMVTDMDWDPLFQSWVYGCGIPTYTWNYEVENGREGLVLVVNVTQSDVPGDFNAVVPIQITLHGGRTGTNIVPVNSAQQSFRFPIPEEPVAVIFNPDYAVPARVIEE